MRPFFRVEQEITGRAKTPLDPIKKIIDKGVSEAKTTLGAAGTNISLLTKHYQDTYRAWANTIINDRTDSDVLYANLRTSIKMTAKMIVYSRAVNLPDKASIDPTDGYLPNMQQVHAGLQHGALPEALNSRIDFVRSMLWDMPYELNDEVRIELQPHLPKRDAQTELKLHQDPGFIDRSNHSSVPT